MKTWIQFILVIPLTSTYIAFPEDRETSIEHIEVFDSLLLTIAEALNGWNFFLPTGKCTESPIKTHKKIISDNNVSYQGVSRK